jgi:hypothetical protein
MMLKSLACSSGKGSPWLSSNIAISLLKQYDAPKAAILPHVTFAQVIILSVFKGMLGPQLDQAEVLARGP